MNERITDGETVKRFLRHALFARITNGDSWLVPGYRGHWCVYRRPYGARKNETLYDGEDFQAALAALERTL